jgi:hypothetical protein
MVDEAMLLRKLLASHKTPKREAARALEIHQRTMRKYCSGDAPIPKTVELAVCICYARKRM